MKKNFIFAGAGVLFGALGGIVSYKIQERNSVNSNEMINKRTAYYYDFLLYWLKAKNEGLDMGEYFREQNYHNIAIYGAGKLCVSLYEEIKDIDNINILYVVDKGNEKRLDDIEIIKLNEVRSKKEPDVVIVTPIYDYKEIEKEIRKEYKCPIVSLEDLIYAE